MSSLSCHHHLLFPHLVVFYVADRSCTRLCVVGYRADTTTRMAAAAAVAVTGSVSASGSGGGSGSVGSSGCGDGKTVDAIQSRAERLRIALSRVVPSDSFPSGVLDVVIAYCERILIFNSGEMRVTELWGSPTSPAGAASSSDSDQSWKLTASALAIPPPTQNHEPMHCLVWCVTSRLVAGSTDQSQRIVFWSIDSDSFAASHELDCSLLTKRCGGGGFGGGVREWTAACHVFIVDTATIAFTASLITIGWCRFITEWWCVGGCGVDACGAVFYVSRRSPTADGRFTTPCAVIG